MSVNSVCHNDIPENLIHIVILDISGVYAYIYDQGYYDGTEIEALKQQYKDNKHWQLVCITR